MLNLTCACIAFAEVIICHSQCVVCGARHQFQHSVTILSTLLLVAFRLLASHYLLHFAVTLCCANVQTKLLLFWKNEIKISAFLAEFCPRGQAKDVAHIRHDGSSHQWPNCTSCFGLFNVSFIRTFKSYAPDCAWSLVAWQWNMKSLNNMVVVVVSFVHQGCLWLPLRVLVSLSASGRCPHTLIPCTRLDTTCWNYCKNLQKNHATYPEWTCPTCPTSLFGGCYDHGRFLAIKHHLSHPRAFWNRQVCLTSTTRCCFTQEWQNFSQIHWMLLDVFLGLATLQRTKTLTDKRAAQEKHSARKQDSSARFPVIDRCEKGLLLISRVCRNTTWCVRILYFGRFMFF